MSETVLKLENLTVKREDFWLKDIKLQLEAGTITGLIGRNGMGKTTLLEGLLGMLPHTQGTVLFWGEPLEINEEAAKQKLAYVPDGLPFPPRMTLQEAAKVYGTLYTAWDSALMEQLCRRLDVPAGQKLGALSKGTQMKASIVFALSHHPALLLLDEPTAGLDPAARMELLDVLYEAVEQDGAAVLLSTHITTDLDKVADYIALIKEGKLQFYKEKEKLLDSLNVVAFDPGHLNEEREELLLGYRTSRLGAEGIVQNKRVEEFGIARNTARPTLEEIICLMG